MTDNTSVTCECESLVNLTTDCLMRSGYVVDTRCTIAGREPANSSEWRVGNQCSTIIIDMLRVGLFYQIIFFQLNLFNEIPLPPWSVNLSTIAQIKTRISSILIEIRILNSYVTWLWMVFSREIFNSIVRRLNLRKQIRSRCRDLFAERFRIEGYIRILWTRFISPQHCFE